MTYYVTTPIYYVNAEPHLGHAYSTMAADVLARHMRQRGEDVFFLTGTDEHGEPIANAAEREGISPQELADRNTEKFREMGPIIGATNDFFIRTSDPRHAEKVAEIMQRVYDNGWVNKGVYEGWYCPRCADFKTERELGPGNTCPIHEIPLDRVREENWFFRLSAFQHQLEELYEARPDFVVPEHRRNEAVAFIKQGLEDVSLSRPKLKWGMRLPWDPEQRMYVWFDALLNYVTALSFAREGEDLTERFWPADLHLMAKDILKFHAVIWPALCMAADLEVPRRMVIHGYLLMGEKKMSKSLGNVLDPFEVIDRFGADALRFYCFREVSFGQDGSISTAGFEARYETELANDYGNLASRVLAMVERYRAGTVPIAAVDATLAEDFEGVLERFSGLLDRAELSQALEEVWKLVRRLNQFVEETQPWVLAKDEADPERLDEVLYNLVEGLRVTTLLLLPYLPRTGETLLGALAEEDRALADFGSRPGGQRVERNPLALPEDRATRLMSAPVLAVRDLHKKYRRQEALAGIDLEVGAGELVGLLGPNGAGKSTLTKISCGLVRPSQGRVEVLGRPAGTPVARAGLGYLAELFRFPGWCTAAELLELHQRLGGSSGGAVERAELLDLVELGDVGGKRIEEMSKGMQQRLGIAQALVGNPRLLLLDEPTSALDPVGRRIVRGLLEQLRGRGVAVLLNSHLLSEVELVCDRVAIIARGRLVKAGRPDELEGTGGVEVELASGTRLYEGSGREEVPRIVAELVAAGEQVYRVEVRRSSLEDVYLDAVGGETG